MQLQKNAVLFLFFVICLPVSLTAQNKPVISLSCNAGDVAKLASDHIVFNNITFEKDRDGHDNSAIRFSGQQSFIRIDKNIDPSAMPELSITFWAKPDVVNQSMTLVSNDNGDFDRSVAIDARAGGGWKWSVYCGRPIGSTIAKANKWTFVGVVFDAHRQSVLICINGKFYEEQASAGSGLDFMHIGDNPSFGESYVGLLDDINIYDKALSRDALTQIFEAGGGTQADTDQYYYSEDNANADVVIRVGDVDNLGFGWPAGFDPFCGQNTSIHPFPWKTDENDAVGTDRIMVVSSYKSGDCDGYAASTQRPENMPVDIVLKYPVPQMEVQGVVLQMMMDDFQAPVWGASYQFYINNKRLPYVENIINQLSQTGPVGKLLQVKILPEDNNLFLNGRVSIRIDDPISGAGDGFAIDFIQLLINPKGEYTCIGNISGVVKDEAGNNLPGVLVSANGLVESLSDREGRFTLRGVPSGLITLSGDKDMYIADHKNFELLRDENKTANLTLKKRKGESSAYLSSEIKEKGFVNLYGIHFDTDKDLPRNDSEPTLEEIAKFLPQHRDLKIDIIGHTDSDGDKQYNKDLSMRRALAVIQWLKNHGVEVSNLHAIGLGASSPVASNQTAAGKALNRRVELRIGK